MSGSASVAGEGTTEEAAASSGKGRRLLVLFAAPLLLVGGVAGLWFSGVLPGLLGLNEPESAPSAPSPGVFAMPDIIVNLNVPAGRRPSYLKLAVRIEVADQRDLPHLQAALPRLQDLFTTYLRELRPEELRGSAGTHRLREELTARARIAAHPASVTDVLFVEMLVQ